MAAVVLFMSPDKLCARSGPATWGTVPSPNGGFGPNELFGVDVLSATDIWAVGNSHAARHAGGLNVAGCRSSISLNCHRAGRESGIICFFLAHTY
jgi:hypothetical protein